MARVLVVAVIIPLAILPYMDALPKDPHSRNLRGTKPDDSRFEFEVMAKYSYRMMDEKNGDRYHPPMHFPDEAENPFDELPDCNKNKRFRRIDGTCNNLNGIRQFWGAAKIPLRRFVPQNFYENGINSPRSSHFVTKSVSLPTARNVSLAVHLTDIVLSSKHSHLLMSFGQFTDHDISLSPEPELENGEEKKESCCDSIDHHHHHHHHHHYWRIDGTEAECFPLPTPNDPIFERKCIPFLRSATIPGFPGDPVERHQINDLTAYIDGSNVYGSTRRVARSLRTGEEGKLKISLGKNDEVQLPEFPDNPDSCPKDGNPAQCLFKAGDVRASENAALTSIHTLFLKEHNRITDKLIDAGMDSDKNKLLYNTARKIVGAILQRVTYREFLPEVLGPQLIKYYGLELLTSGRFTGYSEDVDASVRTEFSTAAFRFGHSLVRQKFSVPDNDPLDIRTVFNSFYSINKLGSKAFFEGLIFDQMSLFDKNVIPGLRDRLFNEEMDLPAFNIQRDRDHGIPSYNEVRAACYLPVYTNYDDMVGVTHESEAIDSLKSVYPVPGDIELFPGGLAESSVSDGVVGETFGCMIALQFQWIKFGDRFWHETDNDVTGFTDDQLDQIRHVSLASLVCENFPEIPVRENMFRLEDSASNPDRDCSSFEQIDFSHFV